MNSYQKLNARGTTRTETAQIVSVITKLKIYEVVAGSYDVDCKGRERFVLTTGQILELRDSEVKGYILAEPADPVAAMWESKKEEKGNA
jgi:hypothetical protein